MAKFIIFPVLVMAVYAATPFILLGDPDTATLRGIVAVSAEYAGYGLAAVVIGALGLLYAADRFRGFVVGTVIVAALQLAGAARAQDTGAYWVSRCTAQEDGRPTALCGAFIRGVDAGVKAGVLSSAASWSRWFDAQEWLDANIEDVTELSRGYCPPEGVTFGQMAHVFGRFLEDHPEAHHQHAGMLVTQAWAEAFPCEYGHAHR